MIKKLLILSLFLFALSFCSIAFAQSDADPSAPSVPTINLNAGNTFDQDLKALDQNSGLGNSPAATASPLKTTQAYSQAPISEGAKGLSAVDPSRYRLEPGDTLDVQMWTPQYMHTTAVVNPRGNINILPVGEIPVRGVLVNQLAGSLHGSLLKYYKKVTVSATLVDIRTVRVQVLGEVLKPGSYEVPGTTGAMDAIELAGGLAPIGSLRQIEFRESGSPVKTVDYFRWRVFGDNTDNPYLTPNAVVYVPVLKSQVAISGEVKRPGSYEILPGETLQNLVAMAGGYTPDAVSGQIKLSRLSDAKANVGVAPTEKLVLENGDHIHVPSSALFAKKIKVIGEVNGSDLFTPVASKSASGALAAQAVRVGWYRLHDNEKVQDVLVNLGGLTPNADATRVRVERKTSSGNIQVIPVNAQKIFANTDPSQNITLQDGDTLIIPPIADSVYVLGEVNHPGVMPYAPGDQIREYLALAGGPTTHAHLAHAQVVRVPAGSVDPVVYPINLEQVMRGDKSAKNIYIEPGDVIYIPRTEIASFSDVLSAIGNISIVKAIFFK